MGWIGKMSDSIFQISLRPISDILLAWVAARARKYERNLSAVRYLGFHRKGILTLHIVSSNFK